MIKLVKYETGWKGYEVVTIEDTTATHEYLFTDNKAVWKMWTDDIIHDYKWKDTKSYIKRLKALGFKELAKYKDDLKWINFNTGRLHKQYEFEL
jgi:hypothetical protein